ncbi:MAG: tRNA lysidine(34) synthetase TilS, partial [Phycisphaerales bacterium]|nr:tRNA lysidine(34) synthetase TilS [Phycisphaerales bacterium]
MTNARPIAPVDLAAVRADDAARAIARDWRRLTAAGHSAGEGGGGGRTLVACSAGADSTALLLALAAETDNLVVAYIRHDMRPRQETDIELAQMRDLAEALSLPSVTADVRCAAESARGEGNRGRGGGNNEAAARRARYHALPGSAGQHACPFVAVGHHADDLLETQIMWFIRGASLRGLGSLRPKRTLSRRVTLIRPMLSITRDDARRLCTLA